MEKLVRQYMLYFALPSGYNSVRSGEFPASKAVKYQQSKKNVRDNPSGLMYNIGTSPQHNLITGFYA